MPSRGIGNSFQLAITAPRKILIDHGTTSAQSCFFFRCRTSGKTSPNVHEIISVVSWIHSTFNLFLPINICCKYLIQISHRNGGLSSEFYHRITALAMDNRYYSDVGSISERPSHSPGTPSPPCPDDFTRYHQLPLRNSCPRDSLDQGRQS